MPYIPHTAKETEAMLKALGVKQIDQLFDEIPKKLLKSSFEGIAEKGMTELEVTQLMQKRAAQNQQMSCFIGAGAYEHYISATVWQLTSSGQFVTAYTPYQAEASQGTLQTIYEYQSMIAHLMAMDISNASMYDGASALAEAVLMASRLTRGKKTDVLLPLTVNPFYRDVVKSMIAAHNISLHEIPCQNGVIDYDALRQSDLKNVAALVIPQPNFFGQLEAVDLLTQWAEKNGILTIAQVNPLAMAILKPPGKWGASGADIVCGEAQPLGIPLASGGPYMGFLCCKEKHIRQMPGRIVGETVDTDGNRGYTLTLQAREQHIRRQKATSNICTNQGLMMTAITIYLSLMGAKGLAAVAKKSHINAKKLLQRLLEIPGIQAPFPGPFFHEFVIKLPCDAQTICHAMAKQGICAGYVLEQVNDSSLSSTLLICVTETKTDAQLAHYAKTMAECIKTVKKGGDNNV
jgi:glycine dehydrogenase subunit 1